MRGNGGLEGRGIGKKRMSVSNRLDEGAPGQTSTGSEKKAADFFEDFEPSLETFDEVFNYIKTKWTRSEKLVIIIDEFSYLAQQDDSIPSVFQLIVDEILKDGPFHLILCGSSVSMIEKSTLAYSSPLYGRKTGQIKVHPILFRHVKEFFSGLSQDELVKIFGAAGGVPFYLPFFDPNDTFQNNLKHNFFAKDSVLYAECEFLLREELRACHFHEHPLCYIKGRHKASGYCCQVVH